MIIESTYGLYLIWMILPSISFFLDFCVLINIVQHKEWWKKTFYQLIFPLTIFDLIGSASWFGPSFHMPEFQCRIREYIFQGTTLYKSSITVAFCYISLKIIQTMQPCSNYFTILTISIGLIFTTIILMISIVLNTASIYCREDFHENKFIVIGILEVGTIYFYILLDFIFYSLIRNQLNHLPHHFISQSLLQQQSSSIHLTNETKLVYLVRKLRFYPFLFFICFLPESFSILYSILTGRSNIFLVYISSIFLPSNGIAMSTYYFIQQDMFPDVRSIYNIKPSKLPTEYFRGYSKKLSSDTESNHDHHTSDTIPFYSNQHEDITRYDYHSSSSRKYSRLSSIESDHHRHPDVSIDTFQTAISSPPHLNLPTNTHPVLQTASSYNTNLIRSALPQHSSEQFLTRNISKASYHTTQQETQENNEHLNHDHESDNFEQFEEHNCHESLNSEFIHTESFSSSCRDSLISSHPQESNPLVQTNHPSNTSQLNQQHKKELLKKYNSKYNDCILS